MNIFDKFFTKYGYKFPKGYPDMNNEQDILLLESILEEILEAKQVGVLYHFTTYGKMIEIVNNNFILNPKIHIHKSPYISFTRDKYMKSHSVSQEVRIKIDGDKLSETYKITPHADVKAGYSRMFGSGESEERIDLTSLPDGVDISNSIINIDVLDIKYAMGGEDDDFEEIQGVPSLEDYNTLLESLSKSNKPYSIVQKYQ
jgi:hypothetical protein